MFRLVFVIFYLFFADFAKANDTIQFTDSTGNTFSLPKNVTRIVPSGPASQMMLLAFAPEKLVGLSNALSKSAKETFPTAANLPVFGQLYGASNLNVEALLANKPQAIIDIGEAKKNVKKDMAKLTKKTGLPAIHIDARLNNMSQAFLMLGDLLNMPEKGKKLSDYTHNVYTKIIALVEKHKDNKPSVLYLLGTKGTNVLAKGAYHAQVLDLMGNNVADLTKLSENGGGNEVNLEQILIWQPEVLIYAPYSAYNSVYKNPILKTLTAVQNKRVYESPAYPFDWISTPPAVNRYMGLIWLAELLYPNETPFDFETEANRFYQLFYNKAYSDFN